MKRFAFVDHDLSGAGWAKALPEKASFFRSFLCRGCDLYIVDFGTTLTRREAEHATASLTPVVGPG